MISPELSSTPTHDEAVTAARTLALYHLRTAPTASEVAQLDEMRLAWPRADEDQVFRAVAWRIGERLAVRE